MDQKLLFLINHEWTSPALDRVMTGVSSFGAWAIPLLFAGVLILLLGGWRARLFILTAGAIVGINDGVISNSLKRLVDRPRPHQALSDVRQLDLAKASPRLLALFRPVKVKRSRAASGEVDGRSFPSSHTMNCFAAAITAVAFYGRRALWGLGLAALVGYSRIYVGSHWPSDVLISILLASGSTLLLLALADWLWHRFGRPPGLFQARAPGGAATSDALASGAR